VGHLTSLRRTRSGCFTLEEALPLDTPDDELAARVEHLARAASRALPVARLSEVGARDAHHGRPVQPGDIDAPTAGPCAWLDPHGALVAVGELGRVLRGFGP
jgi:tRNA pseudouridine55 synthase